MTTAAAMCWSDTTTEKGENCEEKLEKKEDLFEKTDGSLPQEEVQFHSTTALKKKLKLEADFDILIEKTRPVQSHNSDKNTIENVEKKCEQAQEREERAEIPSKKLNKKISGILQQNEKEELRNETKQGLAEDYTFHEINIHGKLLVETNLDHEKLVVSSPATYSKADQNSKVSQSAFLECTESDDTEANLDVESSVKDKNPQVNSQ